MPTVKTSASVANKGYIPGGAPSNIKPVSSGSSGGLGGQPNRYTQPASSKAQEAPIYTSMTGKTPSYMNNTAPAGGNNYSSGGSSSGGSGGDYSYSGGGTDDIVNMIKSLLNEQKAAADKYYNTLYDQRLNQINQEIENNRNLINKEYKMAGRRNYAINGRSDTGANVTNQTRINQNWLSNLASNRQAGTNLRDSALAQRDMGLANNASTLAQGWYNYILPVYTNRQNTLDDYAYRRYLANL